MASMKDVANAAGVSQPAVSYAYSGSKKISEDLRKHIFSIANELGYPGPNVRAGSLRSGRVGAIGLIVMDNLSYAFADPWVMSLLEGISSVNDLRDVALTLFPMNNNSLSSKYSKSSSLAVRGLVDGLIISTLPDNHMAVNEIIKNKIPLVIIDSPRVPGVHYVGIDDRQAAKCQLRHLLELGHRKIGIIIERLIPDAYVGFVTQERFEKSSEMITRERLAGYIEVAMEFGISFEELKIFEAGGFNKQQGSEAAKAILQDASITGIIASSDVMALAAMNIACSLGFEIPADISIVGFDNIPESEQNMLTTIHQPTIEKGIFAAELLLDTLKHPQSTESLPQTKIFPTKLVIRQSTSMPRST